MEDHLHKQKDPTNQDHPACDQEIKPTRNIFTKTTHTHTHTHQESSSLPFPTPFSSPKKKKQNARSCRQKSRQRYKVKTRRGDEDGDFCFLLIKTTPQKEKEKRNPQNSTYFCTIRNEPDDYPMKAKLRSTMMIIPIRSTHTILSKRSVKRKDRQQQYQSSSPSNNLPPSPAARMIS